MIVYTAYATKLATIAGRTTPAIPFSRVCIVPKTRRDTAMGGKSEQHVDTRTLNELIICRHNASLMTRFGLISRARAANARNHMRRARRSTTRSYRSAYIFVPATMARSIQRQ